jgi:hypothetical protein
MKTAEPAQMAFLAHFGSFYAMREFLGRPQHLILIKKLKMTAVLEYKRRKLALGELGMQAMAEEIAGRIWRPDKAQAIASAISKIFKRGQGEQVQGVFDPWFKNPTKYGGYGHM